MIFSGFFKGGLHGYFQMEENDEGLILGEFYKDQRNGIFLFFKKEDMKVKIAEYKSNKLEQMLAEYKIQSKEGNKVFKISNFL